KGQHTERELGTEGDGAEEWRRRVVRRLIEKGGNLAACLSRNRNRSNDSPCAIPISQCDCLRRRANKSQARVYNIGDFRERSSLRNYFHGRNRSFGNQNSSRPVLNESAAGGSDLIIGDSSEDAFRIDRGIRDPQLRTTAARENS